ncbi:MAG: LCP family protein [Oscillospiraceae bacterium]|nr:LCP family protein [Oscillospiraceae bacterium]
MSQVFWSWLIFFACGLLCAAMRGLCSSAHTRALLLLSFTVVTLLAVLLSGMTTGTARSVFTYLSGGAAVFTLGAALSWLALRLRAGVKKRAKRNRYTKAEYRQAARRTATRSLAALTVLLLVASLGASMFSGVECSASLPAAVRSDAFSTSKSLNLLVCGVDYVSTDAAHQQAMSDVILIANIDKAAARASLLQIPRDTYVGAQLTNTGKINALFNTKSTDGRGGVFALAEVLNDQLQLPLDHYICITMEGFRAAVDIIGGVDIELDQAMVFNLRDENEVVVRTVTLGPGLVTLDGETADLFVRYRDYIRADLDRMDVQRYFLAALLNKLSATSAPTLLRLARRIYPYVDTDLSLGQLLSLALTVKGFSGDAITALRAPGEPVNDYNGQSVFSLHKEQLAQMLNDSMRPYSDDVPAEQLGVVELQNTTSILDDDSGSMSEYGA